MNTTDKSKKYPNTPIRARHRIEVLAKVVNQLITDPEAAGHLDTLESYDRFIGDLAQVVADHTGLVLYAGVSQNNDAADGVAFIEFDVTKPVDDEPTAEQLLSPHLDHADQWMIQAHVGGEERLIPFTGTYDATANFIRAQLPASAIVTIEPLSDFQARRARKEEMEHNRINNAGLAP